MRWVFLLLLMANGFYYFWWQQQSAAEESASAAQERSDDVATLVLLDELPEEAVPKQQRVQPIPEALVERMTATPAVAEQCWQLGPFSSEERARNVVETLREGGEFAVTLEPVEIPGKPDYWVHVGPFASRAEARARFRELQAKGIDSFLIRDGDLKNAVSLGLFSNRDRADRAREQYRSLDYPVQIHTLQRSSEGYSVEAKGILDEEAIEKHLSALPGDISKKICE